MVESVAPIVDSLSDIAKKAVATAAAYKQKCATENELLAAAVACWDEMKSLRCDIPNPRGYVGRTAWTA
jgi:hypothetical protein